MADIAREAIERGIAQGEPTRDVSRFGIQRERQLVAARDTAWSGDFGAGGGVTPGEEARRNLRWGENYLPAIPDSEARQHFSCICQRIVCELRDLDLAGRFVDGILADEGAGAVAEIASLLETMFDCPFGDGEALKSVVVAIQSQTNNAGWTQQTIGFLRAVMTFLSARYLINEQTVDEVYAIMEEHGLDRFRGSVSDRGIRTRYRLVEIKDE